VALQSKKGQPLARYFPEIVAAVRGVKAARFVLDAEIVVPVGKQFSFDHLLQRIHPAASRIERLARESAALLIVFDLLVDERGHSLIAEPLAKRRRSLEKFARRHLRGQESVRLSPAVVEHSQARRWLAAAGHSIDGVVAKDLDAPYRSGQRTAMRKVKTERVADCVVGGFRYAEGKHVVGSLLLGLYDEEGLLHHVGFTAAFRAAERESLVRRVRPLIEPPGFTGRAPGGPSRWSTKRSSEWEPLRPELVVEVSYDHFTGGRFRHGARVRRWRPDKPPRACTLDQVEHDARIGPMALLNKAVTSPKPRSRRVAR
jgi:ATP-dependent DNA ligase